MAQFRRNRRNGRWNVFGPATEVVAGRNVEVLKKSGDVTVVHVIGVSAEFEVDGVPHVYGYIGRNKKGTDENPLKPSKACAVPKQWNGPVLKAGYYLCEECGGCVRPDSYCWETGGFH